VLRTTFHISLVAAIAGSLFACSASNDSVTEPVVQHDLAAGPYPWTKQPVDYDADSVRFAVFSDLTGGEREGVFDIAVEQLDLLRPELIVNIGDLIDGSTDREEVLRQWDAFDARANRALAKVFYTGGNHDLLGEQVRRVWEERVGPYYYHFRYRDLLFLVLDTEDHSIERAREIEQLRQEALRVAREEGREAARQTEYAQLPEDETGMISQEQADYMMRALAENPDVRWTFLLMHKAPWVNEDMATWTAIEDALRERPYTVFHGHRHGYEYERRRDRDYIRLATTGGVFQPEFGPAFDQIVWVTVDGDGAHIANLKMSGVLDKTGRIPHGGEDRCLEFVDCADQ